MKRDAWILALLTLLFATVSCGSRQEAPSATSFAHLGYSPTHLIHYPDGATIRHCGDYGEELRRAITMWGEAIGYSYQFVTDCRDPMIRVHRYGSSVALRECEKTGIKTAFARPNVSPRLIVECYEFSDRDHFGMILHETGHLFGMGDTYGDWKNNVSNQYVRDVAESALSVMRGQSATLQADDIIGIQELATGHKRFGSSSGLKWHWAVGDQAKELIDSLKDFIPTIDPMTDPERGKGSWVSVGSERHRLASCWSDKRCWVWAQEPDRLTRFKLDSAASERLYQILWSIRDSANNDDSTLPNNATWGTHLDAHNITCNHWAVENGGEGYRCYGSITTN
jgi:hypothetical protein